MRTLHDYKPWLDAILKSVADKCELTSDLPLEDIVRNPRLIAILNHSTPLSWIPAICLLATEVCAHGGGDRIPRGIVDKWFYSNPATRWVAEYVTQSSTPQSFEQILSDFRSAERTDLVIFPEGAYAFFGDPAEISEFRSSKFIELSIRTGSPILIAVHKGSENWSLPLHLPKELSSWIAPYSKFFSRGLLLGKALNLPLPIKKIPHFKMHLKLYSPALYEADLSEDPVQRRSQTEQEAENIRQLMHEMFEAL